MKKTVLIVHTDRKLATHIQQQCRRYGLVAKVAYTAVEAFSIMDERLPDLVCLDPTISTGHTLSVPEMMATEPEAAKVPLILLTERITEDLLQKTSGMCAYFIRPSRNLEHRLEAVVYELVDVEAISPSNVPSSARQHEHETGREH